MTDRAVHLDALLAELLERRAGAAQPGSLLAEIVGEAGRTPQLGRATWPFVLGSRVGARLAAAALAVVLVLAGGLALLRPALGPGASPTAGPPASPTPGSSSSASPPPSSPAPPVRTISEPDVDAPPLAGGTWQTAVFAPRLRFGVPDGAWTAAVDAPRQLLLRARLPGAAPTPEYDTLAVVVIENVYVDPCLPGPAETEPWDGAQGPAAFLDWLETAMGASLGPRAPVTILGAAGLQVEFSSPDLSGCAGNAVAISDVGAGVPFRTNLATTPVRYAVVDLLGRTVLVATWAHEPARAGAVWVAADALLATLEIAGE